MKKILFSLTILFATAWSYAQDTINIMHYNLLQYGNYNSSFAGCNESSNNTQEKDECIRTILDYVKPDILTVNEFGATDKLCDDFLKHNLNINGVNYWHSDNRLNYANSSIINHIFYDSRKFGLKKHIALRTSPRDTDIYELYCKSASLVAGDTIKIICVVAHLKAGMNYQESRRAQLQTAMNYIYNYYPSANTLIMGDFNMYSSNESGYQLLTRTYAHNEICFIDPVANLGGVGPWNENQSYASHHTQSTNRSNVGCKSSGGLDDRFDFILMSDEVGFGYNDVRYVNNSYKAIGNDGQHFNKAINENSNTAVPTEVANALFKNSDHLPINMKLTVNAKLVVDENAISTTLHATAAPNPASGAANICFYNEKSGNVQFEIFDIQGRIVSLENTYLDKGNQLHPIDVSNMTKGFYLLRIKTPTKQCETIKLLVR
jgi:Endonuclease/Exonuclease/phosphatase family.